jgi:hypothetical protein
VLTGPFANGYNEAAEMILNDFLKNVVGSPHRFLVEHFQNGLPDLSACLEIIRRACRSCVVVPSGYLHHWLPLMIIKHDLARIAGGQSISGELDRFYNYASYWGDHRLPSYRQIVVAAGRDESELLRNIERVFEQQSGMPRLDLSGVIAMWRALRWNEILAEREKEIHRLRAENERLATLAAGYASGRIMRFLDALNRLVSAARRKQSGV